ncbi:RNA helicase [Zychaea mexicana]|uniref:RNA helicase n=1 Tax=Zychaea mexicana TaxID=64656 RepID=UPI0022FDB0CD|nr:RNA helicase [Zychaea mexicana]KAI9493210.1 RNA helicase [Zychaea mexicana]
MSQRRGRNRQQQKWDPSPWDPLSGPSVVNATLNFNTNQFDIAPSQQQQAPSPKKSKFDFSSNFDDGHSMTWTMDMQQGWDSAPTTYQTEAWNQPFQSNNSGEMRYSKHEPATFKLNADIPDKVFFTQEVDFTSIQHKPIIPEPEDILQEEDPMVSATHGQKFQPLPNIPVNRVNGSYESPEQYLYTHFELMRNDLLIPLRNAVKYYKESVTRLKNDPSYADHPEAQPIRGFRAYEHVRLNALVFSSRQVAYRISFRLPYHVRISWPQSKRLIEGTMVLLSKDNFENDIKIATVVERGEQPTRGANRFEYLINIHLERDNENDPLSFGDPTLSSEDNYVMLEATEGYFEAYRHILSTIQQIPPSELPFSPYLVDVSKDVQLPHYAAMKRNYDIAEYREGRRSGPAKPVDITQAWPVYNMNMDNTQMDALKTMLSNNIAVVQGKQTLSVRFFQAINPDMVFRPPGTGKTYVGTYAMRVLLNNFSTSIGPIVCICQTNHALDQFLEHILDHEDKIVRIGSRSKSELLKEHLLFELRKQSESVRGVGRLYRKRDDISKRISSIITEMYEEPCVSMDYIKKINGLNALQRDYLQRLSEREEKRATKAPTARAQVDDEDDWVTSTPQPTPPPEPRGSKKKGRGQQQQQQQRGRGGNDWAGGNPNIQDPAEEKKINPVEIWLKDAIEFVGPMSSLYSYTHQLKEDLLDTQKGLVFEDDVDESDLVDEEELQEITANFAEEPDTRKRPFINIGSAYQKKKGGPSVVSMYDSLVEGKRQGTEDERKVINYKKIKATRTFDASSFNFFEDTVDESALEPQHLVLERWMKEEPDVTMWPLPVRLEAHKKWADERYKDQCSTINHLISEYERVSVEIRRLNMMSDAQICRKNRVIGMTSTAAAKYHDLLEEIRPRIMVVEEAAEMMEAHIVSALTRSLQHLVLIGDHQQLRPQNSVHALAEQHFLNVSLFERLVRNELPFTRLSHQRRMRPEIRMLIDPIYSDPPLRDHSEVLSRPAVRGIDPPVYFLSHNEAESHVADTASKTNEHEALMAAKLSTYLLLQGYAPEDITIITMYSGQKSLIRRALRAERRADLDPFLIPVSSVDGYQGEENKIIILSLVRSNAAGQIGFLKVANRVCVALSRAREGMYILGNAGLLCERSDLWNEIVSNMEEHTTNSIGTRLRLRCARHGQVTEVQWPVDFATIPEGGCTRVCGEMLECGHQCATTCHPYDHTDILCRQPCRRLLSGCNHQCTRQCWEQCGTCLKNITVRLPCGHEIKGECGKLRRKMENPANRRCSICLRS